MAANRRNAIRSQGPITDEGKARVAAAQLRHGFYAQSPEVPLDSLGEDVGRYEELLEGLRRDFPPTGTLEEQLVSRLARVLWLMDRAERRLEGEHLRLAKNAAVARENHRDARLVRLKMAVETLSSLARAAARRHYVCSRLDLEAMKNLCQQRVMGEMGEIARNLLLELREPDTDEDGFPLEDEKEEMNRKAAKMRLVLGLPLVSPPAAAPAPSTETEDASEGEEGTEDEEKDPPNGPLYPSVLAFEWGIRERARKRLKNILARQVEVLEAQRQDLLKESATGPSVYELSADAAPSPADGLLLRRMQDANMREVRRLSNMLRKLQRRERAAAQPEAR
jgi:hypothetical protein